MRALKRILFIVLFLGVLFLPISVISGFYYDRQPGYFREFQIEDEYFGWLIPREYTNVSTSITKVTAVGTAEGFIPSWDKDGNLTYKRAVGVWGQEGSGFYIGGGYWVTSAHVVIPSQVIIQESKYSSYTTFPIRIVSCVITIGQNTGLGSAPAEVVFVNAGQDLAVLRIIGNWQALEDLGYRPYWTISGSKDMIFPGMSVAVITAIRDNEGNKTPGFEIRYGRVVANKPILPGELPLDILPWFQLGDVTTDLVIYPGDSGSPVFGFIGGKPVIIGVARALVRYCGEEYDEAYKKYEVKCYYFSYFSRIDLLVRFSL